MQNVSRHLSQRLTAKASQLQELTRLLRACLSQNCQQHVAVAGIRDNQLILVSDSPVWVSRLRMYTQDMLHMLEQHGDVNVDQIRIRQAPPGLPGKPEPEKKYRHLSQSASDMIRQTASTIEDEGLQHALLHLARNTADK